MWCSLSFVLAESAYLGNRYDWVAIIYSIQKPILPQYNYQPVRSYNPARLSYRLATRIPRPCSARFTKLLQRRFNAQAARDGLGRVAHAFTPGFTSTAIFSKTASGPWPEDPGFAFLKATEGLLATHVDQGAATGPWLASTSDEAVTGSGYGGRYWDRMTAKTCSIDLLAEETLAKLWTRWTADAGVEWR